jgi:uncharacterized damage-inducible protein DinB
MRTCALLLLAVSVSVQVQAQAGGGNPLSGATKTQYEGIRGFILKSAEQVPEEEYAFKPTPEVRSFGAILGHIANANYMICSAAAGEKSPSPADIEKTKTRKAELVQALQESFAYCDKVHASMNDARAMEMVTFFRQTQPRIAVLSFNTAHDYEHYGNLVTYMRLKGRVPPSSQGSM